MKPLIIKFAKEQNIAWDEKLYGVEYNTKLESLVISGSGKRVIDDKNAQVELTGSLTTQAQFDATRDEPTDR